MPSTLEGYFRSALWISATAYLLPITAEKADNIREFEYTQTMYHVVRSLTVRIVLDFLLLRVSKGANYDVVGAKLSQFVEASATF